MNGKLVKIKCIEIDITQRELAERLGVPYQQLNNVINERYHNEQLEELLNDFVAGKKPVRYRKKFHRQRAVVK